MEPLSYILGGTLLSVVTLVVGKTIGSNGRVKEDTCGERRVACNKLINAKLDSMDEKLDWVISELKNKIV